MIPATVTKVDFDGEIFRLQKLGGISRYFVQLFHEFSADASLGVSPEWLFSRTSNEMLLRGIAGNNFRKERQIHPWLLAKAGQWKWSRDLAFRSQVGHTSGSSDAVLHSTYFTPDLRALARHQKLAITVYDLIPEAHWPPTPATLRFIDERRAHIDRASVIFTISNHTRDELLRRYPKVSAPVIVTHLGVDPKVFHSQQERHGGVPDYPYALFVGTRNGYKNFDTFVDAIVRVRRSGHDIGAVIVGAPLVDGEARQVFTQLPRNRVRCIACSDAQLAEVYSKADVFVFPSEMEGFGMPLLEAMACGCPVVASDIAVFREVGGSVALFAKAGDADEFCDRIESLLESPAKRALHREAGLIRGNLFSWSETAKKTALGYSQC